MGKINIRKELLPMYIGMITSILLFGSYYEVTSCIMTIYFTLYLLWILKDKKFVQVDRTILCMIIIVASYFLFIPIAVDAGVALIGGMKFLPMIPFVLVVSQMSVEDRMEIMHGIPVVGVFMVVLSSILALNEGIASYFNVSERLSGFFQYPNTFALFCLVGIIVLVEGCSRKSKKELIYPFISNLILLYGIFMSGSRTVMIFLGVFVIISLIVKSLRKGGTVLVSLLGSAIVASGIYVLLVDGTSAISRYLSISLGESTFLGRLLYAKDVIGQIVTHPFGLGYMGYQYTQGAFQTGVYDVAYVHNDFLQFFIDAGWLAGIAMVLLIVYAVKSPRTSLLFKCIAIFISLCALLDFHLQFLSIFMILALTFDYAPMSEELYIAKYKTKKTKKSKKKLENQERKDKRELVVCFKIGKGWKYSFAGIGLISSVYMGIALDAEYWNFDDVALKVFPANTRIYISQLQAETDIDVTNELSDVILAQNASIAIAYREKSVYAFSQGLIGEMLEYKLLEIKYAKYNLTSYTELIDMAAYAKQMYEEMGAVEDAAYCQSVIDMVPEMLAEVLEHTSDIAWKIDDVPELELPSEYESYFTVD